MTARVADGALVGADWLRIRFRAYQVSLLTPLDSELTDIRRRCTEVCNDYPTGCFYTPDDKKDTSNRDHC